MRYIIEAAKLPHSGVYAAAVQNRDGSFSIYTNGSYPEDIRQEAVQELIRRIESEVEDENHR